MALQDVCGFQNLALSPACSPSATVIPQEDGCFYSGSSYQSNLNWIEPEAKYDGTVPLCFFSPKSKSSKNLTSVNHADTFLSPRCHPSASVTPPFRLCHGTTTLAFAFQGGVIAAADSRASAGGLVACPAVEKISPIHSHLVVTSSGSGADCMLWERILAREIRLYQLRYGRRLSVASSAKLLSLMLHPFKGTNVCVALTLCGWDIGQEGKEANPQAFKSNKVLSVCEKSTSSCCSDTTLPVNAQSCPGEPKIQRKWEDPEGQVGSFMSSEHDQRTEIQTALDESLLNSSPNTTTPLFGPRLCYVCSDGTFLKGELFSVGSGSPYAYSVLDGSVRWEMCEEEAVSIAREAVYRATHRDAYSGNNVDIFHITAHGWRRRPREDLREEYHRQRRKEHERVKLKERE